MADAEAKYASGDYEGSLMAYSEALVIYPDSLEILDGLTDAQTALAQNLLKPKPAPRNSESVRVTQVFVPSSDLSVNVVKTLLISVIVARGNLKLQL